MAERKPNLKRDHILDVAERLFARTGLHGTSVREITDTAEVRLASVNYYFGTKEKLYFEVLVRRAQVIVSQRQHALASINFKPLNRQEAIAEITEALVKPIITKLLEGDNGWRSYITVITLYAASKLPDNQDAPELNEYDVLSLEFIEAFHKYSDYQDNRAAHHAFQFITGSVLMLFSSNGRLDSLSLSQYRSNNYSELYPNAMKFLKAGAYATLTKA